jgi:uncharacterized protein with von Willebrand factor type A (vWA) domain
MFVNFFFLLKNEGVPVSITEWMTLMEALVREMTGGSLTNFYYLARAVLVKSEAFFDAYDRAFHRCFHGIQEHPLIRKEVEEWLNNPLPPLHLTPEEKKRLEQKLHKLNLEDLKKSFEERLKEQKEAHHGGSKWVGTGGTSPYGHSGYHPSGIRVGGQSRKKSALQVAAERNYQEYRRDETLGIRQFSVALRRLRQFSTRLEGPKTELDIEETINETCHQAGHLKLVWTRPRKNAIKLLLLMDVGGSMTPYSRLCSQLFSAVHQAAHFKDFQYYFFHNAIYDQLYTTGYLNPNQTISTDYLLNNLSSDYKVILIGDAAMAPSELTAVGGAIYWGMYNEKPGLEWLKKFKRNFSHLVWLNPIPKEHWSHIHGNETIQMVKKVFPMFPLSLEGLDQAVKNLLANR